MRNFIAGILAFLLLNQSMTEANAPPELGQQEEILQTIPADNSSPETVNDVQLIESIDEMILILEKYSMEIQEINAEKGKPFNKANEVYSLIASVRELYAAEFVSLSFINRIQSQYYQIQEKGEISQRELDNFVKWASEQLRAQAKDIRRQRDEKSKSNNNGHKNGGFAFVQLLGLLIVVFGLLSIVYSLWSAGPVDPSAYHWAGYLFIGGMAFKELDNSTEREAMLRALVRAAKHPWMWMKWVRVFLIKLKWFRAYYDQFPYVFTCINPIFDGAYKNVFTVEGYPHLVFKVFNKCEHKMFDGKHWQKFNYENGVSRGLLGRAAELGLARSQIFDGFNLAWVVDQKELGQPDAELVPILCPFTMLKINNTGIAIQLKVGGRHLSYEDTFQLNDHLHWVGHVYLDQMTSGNAKRWGDHPVLVDFGALSPSCSNFSDFYQNIVEDKPLYSPAVEFEELLSRHYELAVIHYMLHIKERISNQTCSPQEIAVLFEEVKQSYLQSYNRYDQFEKFNQKISALRLTNAGYLISSELGYALAVNENKKVESLTTDIQLVKERTLFSTEGQSGSGRLHIYFVLFGVLVAGLSVYFIGASVLRSAGFGQIGWDYWMSAWERVIHFDALWWMGFAPVIFGSITISALDPITNARNELRAIQQWWK